MPGAGLAVDQQVKGGAHHVRQVAGGEEDAGAQPPRPALHHAVRLVAGSQQPAHADDECIAMGAGDTPFRLGLAEAEEAGRAGLVALDKGTLQRVIEDMLGGEGHEGRPPRRTGPRQVLGAKAVGGEQRPEAPATSPSGRGPDDRRRRTRRSASARGPVP